MGYNYVNVVKVTHEHYQNSSQGTAIYLCCNMKLLHSWITLQPTLPLHYLLQYQEQEYIIEHMYSHVWIAVHCYTQQSCSNE